MLKAIRAAVKTVLRLVINIRSFLRRFFAVDPHDFEFVVVSNIDFTHTASDRWAQGRGPIVRDDVDWFPQGVQGSVGIQGSKGVQGSVGISFPPRFLESPR